MSLVIEGKGKTVNRVLPGLLDKPQQDTTKTGSQRPSRPAPHRGALHGLIRRQK